MALSIRAADTFVSRALGLLVGKPLGPREGLLISPCSSIHTVGMRYAIDVVFLDRERRILRICENVAAFRFRWHWGADAVLELQAGEAARNGLEPGLQLPVD